MQIDPTQRNYWQKHLENAPAMLALPTDKQRQAGTVPPKATHSAFVSARHVPSEMPATLHLLAAYTLLLLRHSQQDDIVVGTAVSHHLLPLRTKINPDTTFAQLAGQLAQAYQQAQNNILPLPALVDGLQPAHDESYAPLFQATFAAGKLPETPYTSLYDLDLVVSQETDGWRCCWQYRADLFTEQHIQQFATHFETLLHSAAEHPDCPAMDLAMLPPAERELLLHTWNQTALDVPQDLCLHEWIAQQAAKSPQRTAVSDDHASLTYAELDRQSGQLATYLRQQGVQPGVVVAFSQARTAKVLVTLLGILKAGGTYLPLTAAFPPGRIQFMLDDARAQLLLTESYLAQKLPKHLPLIELDSQWSEITSLEPLTSFHYPPETTAYIIYTSGSTGVPKGVPISQRNIVNLTASMLQEPGMTANDKFLAITALSFDILGYELYSPLVVGGEVVIASEKMMRDGHLLSDRLAEGDITFLQGTPVTWQMLLAADWPGMPNLKMISCGEALTRHLATQLLARGAALWNLYGPTEATIFATGHRVTPEEIAQLNRDDLPIGRPVHNMHAYILDSTQQLLPIGAMGELYLGGAGLSQGYLYREELTAERFITHPFSDDPDAKLYRTGDLARYQADGTIEYLGRTDYQVKVHGFRIELGEIESRLEELAEVQTAVAIAWVNPANNNKHLVAYFVSPTGETEDPEQIRAALKTTLPSYMVPGILMQLPQLPATPNGKVDRKALPPPQETRKKERPYTAPRNPLEEQLAKLWADLFSVKRVGIHDSFLDMGGHSLLATRLISDMQSALGVRLSVGNLFRHETIAELSSIVANSAQTEETFSAASAATKEKHMLSFAQRRLWFSYKLDPQSSAYSEPIAIRLRGPVNTTWLQQSLTNLVTRHEVLRTIYFEEDGVYGRIQTIEQLPLPVLDLRHLPTGKQETAVSQQIEQEDKWPFNLTNQIPIRTKLLHLGEAHWVLLLTLHHIAMDLWSIELIIEEITTLYRAYQEGDTPQLPQLPIQYSDYAAWQENWLAQHGAEQLAYWKNTLAPDPDPLPLLTDKPRHKKQSDEGALFTFQLSDELMQQTDQFMQNERVTLFALLLAAYHALLHRYTQQNEINVGVPIANRHLPHTEKLIGFFTNTIIINASFTPDMTFHQLLDQVWARVLGGQDHQDLPFNKVVEAVQTTRRENVPPLFQTFFTVQAVEGRPKIPGVQIAPVSFETQTAKFDLTLSLSNLEKQINGFVEYRSALFTPERIALLSNHYVNLLTELMAQPDTPIAELDFRTEEEGVQQANTTQTAVPRQSLIEKFTEIAKRFGINTAVSTPTSNLTYQQLHRQSNQISHLLLEHNIQPGDVVAICATPTSQMITAVFGVLKVGALYLPLNEDEPQAWQQLALQNSGAKLLLYRGPTSPVPDLTSCPQLAIETAHRCPTDDMATPEGGGIYLPKLGCYPAADLFRLVQVYPIEANNQVLQFAPFASHPATHEIFATLLNGGTLHLAPREQLTKLSALVQLLNDRQINFAILPAVLIAALDPKRVPHLKTVVCLEADMDQTHWQKWVGRQRLHGHLSAATILPTVLSQIATPEAWLSGTGVPAITLLSSQGQPTPTGVLGTLHIGEQVQSTNDSWCWLRDGRIQFRHYHPTHTTTRGRYVQTDAVAAVLRQHPTVENCIVLPDDAACEKRRLTAYVVPANAPGSSTLESSALTQYAKQQLPAQLVPAHFQTVAQIPLLPSGQTDFQTLQRLQQQETVQDQKANTRAARQSELAKRRQNLSAKQRALLEKWEQKKTADNNNQQHIAKRQDDVRLPLSFAQQRLFLLDQLEPNQSTYNIPLVFRVDGHLDETALQTAVDTLHERHDSLRTTFYFGDDGTPYQHVAPNSHLPVERVDFSALPGDTREKEVAVWIQNEAKRPFNLTTDPLIRMSRLQLAKEQHLLVLVMHHIISDGWSVSILFQEMVALYAAFVQKRPSPLAPLPIQYADFATWQRDWLQGEVLQQQINYWQESLQGAPAILNLPTDRPRPAIQSYRGATLHTQLPDSLMPAIKELAQAENASPFMVLLAAFQLLLARYTQQEDIVVGSPIANRNRTEVEGVIGFFVNMLVLRTNTSGNPTFRTLLSQVRNTTLGAFAHQDIPFEKLVEERQVARDLSYSPLFQVVFILQNIPNQQASLPGLTFSLQNAPSTTSKFDLTLELTETVVGFQAAWEYSTDLFDESSIVRLANHLNSLVQQIITQPDTPIDQFDIITPSEKALMQQWNDTERPFPEHLCLHQLLSQQAIKTPQRTAVSDGQTALTYQQLETQSNQLAHHLIALGVKPNTFVAVALNRTAQLPIALWGILKTGGAYLPVDPAFPAQRIQFMLTDAQVPLLLSQTGIAETLPAHQAQVLRMDELLPTLADLPTTLPETAVTPHDLAYIIYTSGSTGRPKGVQIHHRSLVNLLTSMMDKPGIAPDDKLLAITTLSFDIATVELYLPLLVGAQVVIAPQSALTDPQQLIDLLQENAITLMQATPATWQMLITGNWQGHPGLSMITGGEALSVTLAQQLLARGETLWNMYAPSETTTYSTIQPVLAEELDPQQSIPIGRPLANTQLYILDRNMQPVPIGVTGELYIGGEGVSSGYLNQPDLTAERFIQLPEIGRQYSANGDHSPITVYRTGDLASFRPDGAVSFLGRSDHQVKVRGFRVELGEIESRLRQHPAIAQAVVHPFEQQLVAYLIFEPDIADEDDVSTAVLRTFIQETLPTYMVPHIFMPLESFPLTPNGKVDREALPSPTGERDAATAYVAPRNAIEAQLAEIWQELLPIDQVGVQDNFFALGGHSLLATQLVSRIQKQFNLKLPLRDVFEQSTIAQIARLIDKSGAAVNLNEQPFIPKLPEGQPLPLSFAQRRLLVMDQLDPNQATYNIPLAFKLDGRLDETALQMAVNTLYTRHHSLRTTFYYGEDGQPYQRVAAETQLPIEMVDFSALLEDAREKEVAVWIQNEAKRPFNLTTGPLIRMVHLQLAKEQHILVIVMHHIITDGWSMTLFVREFVSLYVSLVRQLPLTLPALRVQYADFAAWQQNWLQGDVLEQQLAYWQDRLADAPPVLSLPTDFPRPKLQSTRGENHNQLLPKELTLALTRFSQTHNSTLFMTLLTAYYILLLRYTKQKDFVVGTPIANRNHSDIENIIGFFVNMLPLRIQIGAAETFSTLLEQVRQTALDAYQHQDIPFEQVVNVLQPVRDTSHSPIFQVSFVLQNANAALPQLNELALAPLTAESKTAKYDLTLGVTETNNDLLCTWEYSTELFLPETIARMHTHFETLLQAIVQTPDLSVTRLPILPATEKQLLLHKWQGKRDPSIPQMSLSQRVEEWVVKQPEVTAVSDSNTNLTYAQLNQRANQLAHLLINQGVQPGDAVGIHMGDSVPAIITILACHKARAAYVPFDPVYPTQRLQFMLDDTAAPIILTDSSLEHLDTGGGTIWQWDAIQSQLNQQDAANLDLAYTPSDPAYIIYTSGSTGKPKGVVCGHTGVFNLLRAFDQWGELPPQAGSSLWTSLNFDVAVYEIFAPLVSGGALQIVPAEIRTEAITLFHWLAEQEIASVYLPPFMVEPFAAWLKEGNAFPTLRRLLVGVEPLLEQTLVTIQKQLPNTVIINGYGPTEATVCTTTYRISADSQRTGIAPLGQSLLNTQHYLLDEEMQPVPIGVAGELYIGGKGLAQGYLNRPELTAEKFIPNPFANNPAEKLYRTGDLVRYLPDGNILFIGRTDFQLKVRGFRIELGEIESHLLAQPGVAAGVVVPHTAADGQITLVAYFTVKPDNPSPPGQYTLRDALNQALPRYMVPAVWIQLDQLPRTPNDKIDRKALPTPNLDEISRMTTYAPPRTLTEERLVTLWENLLQVANIGIHDNFFSLGGHSLLAVQLITALRQQLDKDVPLRLLFDAPTIAELAHELQKLSDVADLKHIPKWSVDGPLPLSFAQQRLWFIAEMNPQANANYNVPIHLEIEGPLDLPALEYSFNQLFQRHESLRTRYPLTKEEMPYQEILPVTAVSLPITNLADLPSAEKEAQARQLRQQSAQTPFDLKNGPIYRIQIVRLDKTRHQLLFTIHHIAFDAWSTNLFLSEVVAHYRHKTTGFQPKLPDSEVQYADFTLWQQARLTPEVLDEQLAFWRNHLAHAPASLALPTDKPRPQTQTTNGDLYEFTLPPELSQKLRQWAQSNRATLFMTLLTAFYGLLYRHTNQEDIVVGTPIANRNHPDLKNIIGFFLNTMALRAHIEETMTWQELLQQTHDTMVAAHDYQEYPFENLVQALLPDRDPSRHPLFQVMFVLQNQGDMGQVPTHLPIQFNKLEGGTKTSKFDLLLDMQETAVGFTASFEYNTDLFNPSTIERMANHFQQMITAMVSEPKQPIAQANLLTQQEQQQIDTWNDTAVPINSNELVHHRFEQQAEKTPTAVAVEFGNDHLTYAQLETQANQLAHFLQAQDVQPGDRVGILLPRSLAMITAVLATLKAGAGYVPLDPNYPTDRLQTMMQQAEAKLLLTHSSVSHETLSIACHNVDELDLAQFRAERVTAIIKPEQPVYIIFTSGSTGQPKGVTLPHRALNNVIAWQQRATSLQRPTRTLQFTSLSFDVHFQEMFVTWQDGGTLVLIADDVRRDGERLLAYLQEHQIERLFLPFVALQNLAEAAQWQQSYPHTLQEVITAGEALLSTPAIREFFTQLANCAFHNHYGPSESHVVTQYTLGPDPRAWPDLPPIGTPIDNTQIHLLDSNMKPVPIGVPGELYISGQNLALGYFNQPELTAERFIPLSVNRNLSLVNRLPNADHRPPTTVYRTGDLARYLPDGNIQFIGRNDFQVKIRGHRVELGEIETVLNEQPTVQQAVVQAYKPDEGPHQLIAYIKTSETDVISALHAALHERLPAYMVPAHFIQLDHFPLTPSGKINRRALPVPDKVEVARSTPFVAAETELQKQLVQIWEDVLGVSPIGIHDNFFELGGHSLLALRLVAAMHKGTAVKIPLPRLFQEGNIAALANTISNPTAESPLSPVVQLRAGHLAQEPLIVIHPGSGQVLPYLKLVHALPTEQPVYGLQSVGLLPDTPAQTEIEAMAVTYLQALDEAEIAQPVHLLGWSMGGVVAMEMARQLNAAGKAAGSLTLIDTFAPTSSATETNEATLLQWFAQDTGYLTPSIQPILLPDEADMDAQLRHLWPHLQAAGNLPVGLTLPDLRHQFAVFQANYAAMQAYQPQKYKLPVTLIASKTSAKSVRNKWLGWKKYLAKRSIQVLDGTHFTLLQEPKSITRIAEALTKQLPNKTTSN